MKIRKSIAGACALLAVSFGALAGCQDNPRKEASIEDICASYQSRLDQVMKDPQMTDQDRINMIPRLPGYADCHEKLGTGGLTIGGTSPAQPAAGPPDESALRSASAKGK